MRVSPLVRKNIFASFVFTVGLNLLLVLVARSLEPEDYKEMARMFPVVWFVIFSGITILTEVGIKKVLIILLIAFGVLIGATGIIALISIPFSLVTIAVGNDGDAIGIIIVLMVGLGFLGNWFFGPTIYRIIILILRRK